VDEKRARAVSFGLVFHRLTGRVVRVINPDYEFELDLHHLEPYEFMLRLGKADWGIPLEPNSMTLDHVHRVVGALS
jgi:hypothetical protein